MAEAAPIDFRTVARPLPALEARTECGVAYLTMDVNEDARPPAAATS